MALSANTPIKMLTGDAGSGPAAASAHVYGGSMVSRQSDGYLDVLTAGEVFTGHAVEECDNSSGSDGDKSVKLYRGRYVLEVTLASVAVTDIGKDVYASDDATLTLTKGSNSFVGKVWEYVTTNTCKVEFWAGEGADVPDHGHTAQTDGGPLTSPRVITALCDTNGNELIKVTATGSAVNEVTLANAATGNDPSLTASGGDTNVGIDIVPKGTGLVTITAAEMTSPRVVTSVLDANGLELMKVTATASAVNEITIANAATAGAPALTATGDDTNVGITIDTKGTGLLALGSADSLVGLFGATGAGQASHIADPAETATACAAAVASILTAIENIGITAKS